jgi:hypothetical protein
MLTVAATIPLRNGMRKWCSALERLFRVARTVAALGQDCEYSDDDQWEKVHERVHGNPTGFDVSHIVVFTKVVHEKAVRGEGNNNAKEEREAETDGEDFHRVS